MAKTETLTVNELIGRINALSTEWLALSGSDGVPTIYGDLPAPAGDWQIEILQDPDAVLITHMVAAHNAVVNDYYGYVALRDDGDNNARLKLASYYSTIFKLMPKVTGDLGIDNRSLHSRGMYQHFMESNEKLAGRLRDVAAALGRYYNYRIMVAEKKLKMQQIPSGSGENSDGNRTDES